MLTVIPSPKSVIFQDHHVSRHIPCLVSFAAPTSPLSRLTFVARCTPRPRPRLWTLPAMNYTIDDTHPEILYSPGGWAVQSPTDPDLQSFLYSTYHAANADGASFNVTFGGSAIYIFGSKGPLHANYDVIYDGTLLEGLSAYAQDTSFQQPLFQHVFDVDDGSIEGQSHFVSLTVRFSGANNWLDLDYIVFTTPSSSSASPATSAPAMSSQPWTSSAPAVTTLNYTILGLPTASPTPAPAPAALPTSSILAVLFGAITGLALLILLGFALINRRITRQLQHRDGAGRHAYSAAPRASPSPSQPHFPDLASSRAHTSTRDLQPNRRATAASYASSGSHYAPTEASNPSQSSQAPLNPSHHSLLPPPGTSPIRFNHNIPSMGSLRSLLGTSRRERADDADSTRTDFLQV
ncbi:hypothetical protein GLOTRDRAFT_141466 [Gloeophyllum trabeum ATCC 11539]|uniref:Uncharacterized protein n=1 Tax=Gloeophyllum trabeum (strain ATCC 11539 / FP-39264 / Madison 617) TaxID=670483 RepID=S7PTR9_GLOTA|nr:uncharacterized protein GLOTRDRAFT_141466 [Gloeophyllum trabeum ATCC 11539]EPQ50727.1 hypothetical protein GLOTRDRAFT_141466 [Gloeophyllum trabeum ATCC 11539]